MEKNVLGKTCLSVSAIGFGAYRLNKTNSDHRQALKLAIENGCNIVDTSSNYSAGESEELIGEVLEELGQPSDVVLVTKAGYIENSPLIDWPELVKFQDGLWHCIHPAFLENQISQSLSRLRRKQLDVLLLHNPEYFLRVTPNRSEYYRRIEQAFKHLENEVTRGRIKFYGISSNTFIKPEDTLDFTSLKEICAAANRISTTNHFGVIEFPLNLFESGAILEKNNDGKSVLEYAISQNIGVLTNRPLNAFLGDRLFRLANFKAHHGKDLETAVVTSMQEAMRIEGQFSASNEVQPEEVAWAHLLHKHLDQISDPIVWEETLKLRIRPALDSSHKRLNNKQWVSDHKTAIENLFMVLTEYFESKAATESLRLSAALNRIVPSLKDSRALSQKATRVIRSIDGVSCVLVGMKKPEYVREILSVGNRISSDEANLVLETLRSTFLKDDNQP